MSFELKPMPATQDKPALYAELALQAEALLRGDAVLGVLDLDSPRQARFDDDDRAGLERLAGIWIASLC